ncbi:MAG: hypothetical protein KH009_02710 [Clostridiales bacterium]|nr:hypothetical protein [Clostridiales bacterium]
MAVEQVKKEKVTVTPQAWAALILMLCMFSGLFAKIEGPLQFLRVLDLNTLVGNFGIVGTSGGNFMGTGGTGARDGFMFVLSLAPSAIFCMGLIEIFTKMGVMSAFRKVFTPILRPLMGLPGSCGLAFVNSLNGSDIAAVLTKELYDNGEITDDERTILVSFMYPGSAPIGNMISTQAALLPIASMAMGPMILIIIFCKLVGANLVRLVLKMNRNKAGKGEAA